MKHHRDLNYDYWSEVLSSMSLRLEDHVKVRISLFMYIISLATKNVTK
jgi:hypothetical protein